MRALLIAVYQFGRDSIKGLSGKLWLLTHIAIATYLLTLSISQSSIDNFVTFNFNATLGADGIISSREQLQQDTKLAMQQNDISFAETAESSLVLTKSENWLQVGLKAVDEHYPIAGQIVVSESFDGELTDVSEGPKQGEIWLEQGTAAKLGYELGEKLDLAGVNLTFSKVLHQQPDWLLQATNTVPNAMISLADFDVLSADSAVTRYRYLLANSVTNEKQLRSILSSRADVDLQVFSEGKHPFSDMVDRAFKIFSLVSVLLIALAAVALNMSDEDAFKSTAKVSAILMSLGMSKAKVVTAWFCIMLLKLVSIILISAGCALAISYFIIESVQAVFSELSLSWQLSDVAAPTLTISLLFFASLLPSLAKLVNAEVKPLLIEYKRLTSPYWVTALSLSLSVFAIVFIYSDNLRLSSLVIGALGVAYLIINIVVRAIIHLLGKVNLPTFASLTLAIQMLQIRKKIRLPQIVSLGMCAFLLSLSTLLSEEFIEAIDQYGFTEQGDMLFDKANEHELAVMQQWLSETDSRMGLYQPFQFAKLSHINGLEIIKAPLPPSESKSKIKLPIRLSWSKALPDNLEVVEGRWEPSLREPSLREEQEHEPSFAISVEQEVLEDLQLSIGDQITFSSSHQKQSFTIAASHQRKPGSNLISFWFIRLSDTASHSLSEPTLYLGDVFLSTQGQQKLAEFWRQNPQFQMRSIASIKASVTYLVNAVSITIALFTGFLIAICLLVIWTGINACVEQDKVRNALIMSFGKSKFACLKLSALEWLLTGVIAFFAALLAVYGTMHLLYSQHFGQPYQPQLSIYFWVFVENVTDFTILALVLSFASFNTSVKALLTNTAATEPSALAAENWRNYLNGRKFKLWLRFLSIQKKSNNKRT